MNVNELFLSTSILHLFNESQPIGSATGFFYSNKKGRYLVTNKHVIYGEDFQTEGAKPKINKLKMTLHINTSTKENTSTLDLTSNEKFTLELFENGKKKWLEHKRKEIDIVCIPVNLNGTKFFTTTIPEESIDTQDINIGLEKIFILGYPYGWYDSKHNLPIARIGHLSSPFKVPFNGDLPIMIGDIETHPGMSGSPVFMHLQDYITFQGGTQNRNLGAWRLILVGIFSGQHRWTLKDASGKEIDIPHSLSIIWFADAIRQI